MRLVNVLGRQRRFRWDGQGWIGTDFNKLWIKSEGTVTNGTASDGDHEILYDRPMSAPALLGLAGRRASRSRLRSDSRLGRNRHAGTRSLLLQFCANLYVRDGGRVAGRRGWGDSVQVGRLLIVMFDEDHTHSFTNAARCGLIT